MLRLYIKDLIFYFVQRIWGRYPAAILMYHSVGNNEHFFTAKPEEFKWQMRYLKENNYQVVSLKSVAEAISSGKKLPNKSVVLTFDDGYEDNYTQAFPVLKEFGFPATIFLSTGHIGTEQEVRGVKLKHLSESQIKEMAASGLIDFQPHGMTHQKLTTLSEPEIILEMSGSKEVVEKLSDAPASMFAYPFGTHDENIKALATKFFVGALGVRRGYVNNKSPLFDLPRQSVDSKVTRTRFKLKT